MSREDDADAFVFVTEGTLLPDEAEALAEEFIASATAADSVVEDARNEASTEEVGGP